VLQVDGVHESAVAFDELDTAVAQACRRERERRARYVQRKMLHAPDLSRRRATRVGARLIGEYRQQPAVAGIEIQMVLVRFPQVRLLEDEGHAERAFPEIN